MNLTIDVIEITFFIAAIGFGLFLIFKALLGFIYGEASKNWPIIRGVITKSEVISEGNQHGVSHAAIINYNYWIKQKSYTSKRVGFSNMGSRFNASSYVSDADCISKKYPKGDAVEIYYHPKFHSLSVLEPGFSWWSVALLLLGLLGLLFSISAILILIER